MKNPAAHVPEAVSSLLLFKNVDLRCVVRRLRGNIGRELAARSSDDSSLTDSSLEFLIINFGFRVWVFGLWTRFCD